VQAAAVLTGVSIADIGTAWGLGEGHTVEPDPSVDRAAIRAAYASAADDAGHAGR
jgi:hypothetical protein